MENLEKQNQIERLCKLYKFYKQQTNPYITYPLSYNKIKTISFYKKYKKIFDKLYQIITKYKIDEEEYIKFCIIEKHISTPKDLLNIQLFILYANKIKIEKEYRKIYKNFLNTVEYIANNCVEKNITPKEYIKNLIKQNKIGYEYFCGNISAHYLAAIPGIKKIFNYLDNNTKDEMSIIYEATEKLNGDLQEAFMMYKSYRVSPIKFTEQIINNKQQKITNNK
jgi:hypothetical protein